MRAQNTTAPSACTSPGADAVPSNATPAAGVQTELAVAQSPVYDGDLTKIAAQRAARIARDPRRIAVGGYLPASPFDAHEGPMFEGRSEHAVRTQRGDADGWNAGVSW